MKIYLLTALLIVISRVASAQEYITEGKNRLNFAKTYLEIGGQYSTSFLGKKILPDGSTKSFENAPSIAPYLSLG
ncbi:MAG: hypothetical protein EAZ32_00805 [Cytophagia bacterium]|nr:MAG: hypothetical protein EAZ38_03250 [Cytophagales bacterium]TAG42658.1 MAG: hypothetical protein EAZ32_00805 [Cytophagia bacterium]TAG76329.1 MAG: hypothetical protein EAZ22_18405 [Cytophagales bacterium]